MIRKNVTTCIIFMTVLIIGLIGCSTIGYNNDKNNDITVTTLTENKERKIGVDANSSIKQKPNAHINDLALFLNKYDCSLAVNQNICYEKTRARLIQITKELDEAESKIYKLKRSTGILRPH